jgi:hypothetical protein
MSLVRERESQAPPTGSDQTPPTGPPSCPFADGKQLKDGKNTRRMMKKKKNPWKLQPAASGADND